MKTFDIQTHARDQFVNITGHVEKAVAELGLAEGTVNVFTPHTTCGLTINENADPDVVGDLIRQLSEMVPWRQPFYRHGEGNSAAHLKASMMGFSATLLVEKGRLALGVWQGIYLCEFDGPRTRQVWVK